MSGDVQPRKRKDKKRKKDELSIDEPRGTAAALGEGDVFMHSYHDHGTGGHWCAKIIFFSLLAVLITLIGLIILENRGLSELEANAVESRYSGVLEGWLEDAPDDDHHDEHTLELKHHDDDDDDHYAAHDDEHDEDQEDEEETHDEEEHDDEEEEEQDSQEQDLKEADDEDDRHPYKYNADDEDEELENDDDNEDEDDEEQNEDNEEDEEADENDDDENDNGEQLSDEVDNDRNEENEDEENDDDEMYEENNEIADKENDDEDEFENNEDEDEHEDDHEEEDDEVEVERIEQEASEEEPISHDLPVLHEEDDDDDDKDSAEDDTADADDQDDDRNDDDDDDGDKADDDFLEPDDEPVERITVPAGKPFAEVEEDETSSEKPPDTLEEEEEYEKQQEEKRREEEQSSHHMWLKLCVGGALLAATHAVVRRATATTPREDDTEEHVAREETPVVDRRMTLIPEEAAEPVVKKLSQESSKPVFEEIVRRETPMVKSAPVVKQESEEEVEEPEELEEEAEEIDVPKKEIEKDEEKELYSDEEEVEEEEEVVVKKVQTPKQAVAPEPEPEADDEVPDDVEIIDDEQLEEELEEEEISDVDDTELLSRLEAKYGRLPEPDRPYQKQKDGGNSVEEEWAGEPSDSFWRQELDSAEQHLRQGAWLAAADAAGGAGLRGSARAKFLRAWALDRAAESRRDNNLLTQAIAAYIELLKMNEQLTDKQLLNITERTLDRIRFRGNYLTAEPVYRLLIRRFPNEPAYRNNLTISYLMANRADLAEEVLKETLTRWPDDRVALAHYAFVLKTLRNKLEEAVDAFQRALDGDEGPACEPRFYYHYGDALLLLARYKEAHEVHKRGAKHGHFLSPSQRSLYNVPRLKSQPWWNVEETPYANLAKRLEENWKEILKEGLAAKSLFEKEKEGLRERGEWSQMDLFVRGAEIPGRCARAPVTCAAVRAEPRAAGCRRGQVKFSAMSPGTHVRPHVGPTNCRLRMHLGLANTRQTHIRVDQEVRQWQEGKVLLFDDSFEHEVWHNGTGERIVLIVDVWHPDLTPAERRSLPAI